MVLWASRRGGEDREKLICLCCGLGRLPQIERTAEGKPFFVQMPDVHFNLSHSRALLLCGGGNSPIGVDIEVIRPRGERLPEYVLSPEELAWFQERGRRWADFYTLWTLKESRVKQTGAGLRGSPRAIAVPLLEPGQTGQLDGLSFGSYGDEVWRAAACVPAGESLPEQILWRENACNVKCEKNLISF
jgi:4'-phosphopantetheinyl transferase